MGVMTMSNLNTVDAAATLLPPLVAPSGADEANHRIANNLQLLSVLVEGEARGVADAAGRAALDRIRARLAAIAGIHRQLYAIDTSNRVDLGAYLRELCAEMGRSLPSHRPLLVSADRAEVRGETAAALGVLIAELVTNACKHAYPDTMPGAVIVALAALPGGALRLAVEDRGCGRSGLSGDSGLGTRLIDATVRRLQGSAVSEQAMPGTRFRLHLNMDAL
ncbi:sensor histidine kinase [Sphingomonas pituitosa]|uniref:sensor histidine kinase n=1 Tax=Sphingomonas pituitosa TaxID=99597 RepID=UPI00082EB9E7|nr:sensor histidine kinase [Sphingomonas pituitosa]